MRTVVVPGDAVFVLIGRATPEGPLVTTEQDEEWWNIASDNHKRSLLIHARRMVDMLAAGIFRGQHTDG
jgi:hypothetical protein